MRTELEAKYKQAVARKQQARMHLEALRQEERALAGQLAGLEALARDHQAARLMLSVTTLDSDLASRLEPRTTVPRRRLEVIRAAVETGFWDIVLTSFNFRQSHREEVRAAIHEARFDLVLLDPLVFFLQLYCYCRLIFVHLADYVLFLLQIQTPQIAGLSLQPTARI